MFNTVEFEQKFKYEGFANEFEEKVNNNIKNRKLWSRFHYIFFSKLLFTLFIIVFGIYTLCVSGQASLESYLQLSLSESYTQIPFLSLSLL